MKEEKFPHTRKPLHCWGQGLGRGEASEPRRRVQQEGCRVQSRDTPAQRIGTDQHSPAQEDCLLTHQDGWGLGAEAWALEVRSQREDWGWLRKHSLKGASAPQLTERESRKKSGPAREPRPLLWGAQGEGNSSSMCPQKAEHCLSEFQRHVQAVAISSDHRDGHELLSCHCCHQESCVQVQVTIHISPSRSLCSPPLPGSYDPGTTSLGEHMMCLRLLQCHTGHCHHRFMPHSNYDYHTIPSPWPE